MGVPKRDQVANSVVEAKRKLYLPDDFPELPESHLKKFGELAEWYNQVQDWWTDIKDILMRSDDADRLDATVTELKEGIAAAEQLLIELGDSSGSLQECCDSNTQGVESNNQAIGNLGTALNAVASSLQSLSEEIDNSTALSDHEGLEEAHGSSGNVVGQDTLDAAIDGSNTYTDTEVSRISRATDLGAVDDVTTTPKTVSMTDSGKFNRYRFIEISPAVGAGAYVFDVRLGPSAKRALRIDFFINGVASGNPTIRLVDSSLAVIHTEVLDGSGDSILVKLVATSTGNFKVIERTTI